MRCMNKYNASIVYYIWLLNKSLVDGASIQFKRQQDQPLRTQ